MLSLMLTQNDCGLPTARCVVKPISTLFRELYHFLSYSSTCLWFATQRFNKILKAGAEAGTKHPMKRSRQGYVSVYMAAQPILSTICSHFAAPRLPSSSTDCEASRVTSSVLRRFRHWTAPPAQLQLGTSAPPLARGCAEHLPMLTM
jgi:hypothetical protein